jgi:hypothetical protein
MLETKHDGNSQTTAISYMILRGLRLQPTGMCYHLVFSVVPTFQTILLFVSVRTGKRRAKHQVSAKHRDLAAKL